ncbi:MAG: hypothetical protein QOC62_1310 [Mycobacterium sp.]|jgi:hypothetical protein|nr:hypothetical protein [Mycobacterium sp.]MDT5366879.1 hypothetical protein [Mycobacterium sp.]
MTSEAPHAGGGVTAALSLISDDELRAGVLELFERARAQALRGDVDVIVLAARRLACVYQLLVENGMAPLPAQCLVVSDRFLDIDQPAHWRHVLVLDDSVILGTTLLRIFNDVRLRAGDGVDITCWAVCVDVEQRAEYLLQAVNFAPMFERNREQVEQFSTDIVQTLFAGGVPFFSDFPTTRPIAYSIQQWQQHLENPDWYAADVTAPLFEGLQRETFSQIPSDAALDVFLARVDPAVAPLIEGLKVRSFVTPVNDDEVHVRFVPIAMLAPCAPADLDVALEAITVALAAALNDDEPPLRWQNWTPVAKHRLVQLYASSCALEMVKREGGPLESVRAELLDPVHVQLYFGNAAQRVLDLFDAAVEQFGANQAGSARRPPRDRLSRPTPSWLLEVEPVREMLWANCELIAYTGVPDRPAPGWMSKVGLIFAHAITSVFGFINREYELPQRREIRELSGLTEYYELFPPNNVRRVLGQGLTLGDLQRSLTPDTAGSTSWAAALVSLGIDIGNDLGIVVPVTQVDHVRDLVYRCYRLGETAPLAGSPLAAAAVHADWDALAQTADRGARLRNETILISDSPQRADNSSLLDALRDEVERAVPGAVIHRLHGVVSEITSEDFTADFRDPLMDPPVRAAMFPLSMLRDSERAEITAGSQVAWTLLERTADIPERVSRVRVRHVPPLDVAAIAHNAEALSYLLKVDDDSAVAAG